MDTVTMLDLFEIMAPGFKDWESVEDGKNYRKFLDSLTLLGASTQEEKALAFSQAVVATEMFASLSNKQAFVLQVVSFISFGYFMALRDYKLLEKDLN